MISEFLASVFNGYWYRKKSKYTSWYLWIFTRKCFLKRGIEMGILSIFFWTIVIIFGVAITWELIKKNLQKLSSKVDTKACFITKEGLAEIVRKKKFRTLKKQLEAEPSLTGVYFYFDEDGECQSKSVTDKVNSDVSDDILYQATPEGDFKEKNIYKRLVY